MKLKNSNISMSMSIADEIQTEIERGVYSDGKRLPSEASMCHRFYTNRYTIRKAMDRLTDIGLVSRKKGVGYFVNEPPLDLQYTITPFTKFSSMVQNLGMKPSAIIVSQEKRLPSKKVQEALHLSANDEVYRFEFLRFADDTPLAWNETWLPADMFPDISKHLTSFVSLYDILKKNYKVLPKRINSTFQAVVPTGNEGSYLQISPSTPLLQIESIVKDEIAGRMEYTKAKYRGDLCQVTSEL
ncbi:GntR family transcriptional regulator [Halobacillus halophilus]|uniref:GntR family transcriptional regulator n=1 Tax=Halobacillus halophilus TaxID=1570 RepID=UPI001CD3EBE3|nr:GntR family transcriptional regulator [Halobacillus halophilus]MCA1011964.1 GntR family transcriptional regulator [Halobacillus halophilus]